jgi:hypothetical protein
MTRRLLCATLLWVWAGSVLGAVRMQELMDIKISQREQQREAGMFAEGIYKRDRARCVNGRAGEYQCSNVDMLDFLPHGEMGSYVREGSDIWGKFHQYLSDLRLYQIRRYLY